MAYTQDSPLLPSSLPPFEPDQIGATWARFCAGTPNYTQDDLRVIGSAYATTCAAVGLDVFAVLGQVAHETRDRVDRRWIPLASWWSARPRRNPSGIGVSGVTVPGISSKPPAGPWAWKAPFWRRGYSFARWVPDAVETHCAMLLEYAGAVETEAQRALVARSLVHPPARVRGKAPTLRGLGGTWAWPGVGYGGKVAQQANALVAALVTSDRRGER